MRDNPAKAPTAEALTRHASAWAMMLLTAAVITGCLVSQPIVPFPDSIVVPPPWKADEKLGYEDLREAYTVSPSRNPDGLGVFFPVDARSQMTLWSLALERKREEANRIAFARAPAEQEVILKRAEEFHARHVMFQGMLISTGTEFVDVRWYLPEGIYLVDDAGRKFLPTNVSESLLKANYRVTIRRDFMEGRRVETSATAEGFPALVFPGEAIGEKTRAVTLYFAGAGRRFSFTWIFDPGYTPPRRSLGPEHGAGVDRLFSPP